jgi:Kdo2-lipid IVA lauroyltransferase/acyltransferase
MAFRLEALVYDLLIGLVRRLPIDVVSGLGGWLCRLLGPLTPIQKVVSRNLSIAFPDLTGAARRQLIAAQWDNVGRTFLELSIMDRIVADGRIEVEGAERLAEIAASGRPVVVISLHMANWEAVAAVLVRSGLPVWITYREANNPLIDARIRESRFRYGVRLFAPKGDGTREMLEALGRGESVALMNDQKFNAGPALPLFGWPAATAPGPTRMALRFGTVLQPVVAERLGGARFKVVVHPPIELEETGDRAADIEAGVRRVNAFAEAEVRKRPAQWFWVHRRWPSEVYKGAVLPPRPQAPGADAGLQDAA